MPATIRLGDTGENVKRLQRVLARMKSISPEHIDGSFGPGTEAAVKDFQQARPDSRRCGRAQYLGQASCLSRSLAGASERLSWSGCRNGAAGSSDWLWVSRSDRWHLRAGDRVLDTHLPAGSLASRHRSIE